MGALMYILLRLADPACLTDKRADIRAYICVSERADICADLCAGMLFANVCTDAFADIHIGKRVDYHYNMAHAHVD
jgi:hypothetical protein